MYERKRNMKRQYVYGGGLLSNIISTLTSQASKEAVTQAAKQVATKALTETGNRLTQKAINKIIPPKGKGLNEKSKAIANKYGVIPIEEFVKRR